MTLRLIIGRAGSGKTRRCLDEISRQLDQSPAGPPLILLVPEQATFQMERALVQASRRRGSIRAQVLSFRRLAWRVLAETGGAARPHLSELGRQMILRRVLEQRQGDLKVFKKPAQQPGFDQTLSRLLSELKSCCVTPDQLRAAAAANLPAASAHLLEKLQDLSLIYSEAENYLQGRYTDPDDYLRLLAERLPRSALMRGAQVWLDGFTGFTAQEYAVIGQLMTAADRVQVTLCLGDEELLLPLDELELFHPTRETGQRLLKLAAGLGVKVENPLLLNDTVPWRFRRQPALAHLEGHFFQRPAAVFSRPPVGLRLVAGANRRAEVEAAAREMIRLAQDHGLRWREMAVLLRGLEGYQELIAAVFTDHQIPFFLDHKREAFHHPLVELINSAFETIIRGWTYDPLFRYLKTDLVPVGRDEVDRLENLALARGIRGKSWLDEWEDSGYRLQTAELNQVRRRAVSALACFQEALGERPDLRRVAAALIDLLYQLEVPRQLAGWVERDQSAGRLEAAQEHPQVWQGVVELLEQLVDSLGDEVLPLEQVARIVEAGLKGLRLGLIPPALDQVLVGTLDRSRHPEVRAAFLLGVNEGVIPARPAEDGLLTEEEREELKNWGIELAPAAPRRLLDEQYLIYQALTRSTDHLWVSYSLADEEGRTMLPSPVVHRLRELFPRLTEKVVGVEPAGSLEEHLEFIVNPERALSYLTGQLRQADPGRLEPETAALWRSVQRWVASQPELLDRWRRLERSLNHRNQESALAAATSRQLYGAPLRTSVSRLEMYHACPFAHFAAYGLQLRERELFKLAAPDLGKFFHAALKNLGERLREEALDWGTLLPERCSQLVGRVVEETVPQLQHQLLLSTARYRYLNRKLRRTVERAALTLAEHARRSEFKPIGLELGFGRGRELPPLTIELSGGETLELVGVIDRLDLAWDGPDCYLRVIDYKSGYSDLKLGDLYHGLNLQLLTYLDVSLTHSQQLIGREAQPGGMLYFPVRDPLISTGGPEPEEEVSREILRRLRMKGLILADPRVARLMDCQVGARSDLVPLALKKDGEFYKNSSVLTREEFGALRRRLRRQLKESGREIAQGSVAISPYRKGKNHACRFCPYRPVCQFDQLVAGNRYRWLKEPTREEVLAAETEGGDQHGRA